MENVFEEPQGVYNKNRDFTSLICWQDARRVKGSTYESKDHLISCYDFGFINDDLYKEGLELIEKAKISINGYINFVKTQKKGLR
jgi:hypothetical protein